ncbi:cytochrome b/b6 domain-containing protein [Pseudanabaena sp. FACHB-1277]|uniref:Cytochrome b/b6 domain-containing protein n=1 Tax=Pseudanabaena cinerea FACHB-1277 TaxID=2949581 RepID=A0A926UQD1_9CYAN|nr:cytochrome b/b6 domain-containing protein [Pseudanabaena cinerea]MBD2149087.1 cytochrome b/b6 domain-containing protein [Pseudanabaena cinerea FACHB-1277]
MRSPIQALPAKIFHWVSFISLFLMITSGLQIYNANPVFGGREGIHLPAILGLGGWLAGGRHWHFASMWIFSLNLLWYGIYVVATKRWRHRYASNKDIKALLVGQNPKRKNYAWHRLVYTMIIPVLLLAIYSGLGMYKPAQFYWIVDSFGGWDALRITHFLIVPIAISLAALHSQLGRKVGGDSLLDSMFWKNAK